MSSFFFNILEEYELAVHSLQEGSKLAQNMGNSNERISVLLELGITYSCLCEREKAIASFSEALGLCQPEEF